MRKLFIVLFIWLIFGSCCVSKNYVSYDSHRQKCPKHSVCDSCIDIWNVK